MTGRGMALLAAARRILAGQPAVGTARIVRRKEDEVGLGQQPAHLLRPLASERLCWPESPAWQYELSTFELATAARGRPGDAAQRQLAELHELALLALLGAEELLEVVCDGPPARDADLGKAISGIRWGATRSAANRPGDPLEFATTVGLVVCIDEPEARATLDGADLFVGGPHELVAGTRARVTADRLFNGLRGALLVDLGERPRRLVQIGRLAADSAAALAQLEAAIESRLDGATHVLVDRLGVEYPRVRLERFARRGPVEIGLCWHRAYEIEYTAF